MALGLEGGRTRAQGGRKEPGVSWLLWIVGVAPVDRARKGPGRLARVPTGQGWGFILHPRPAPTRRRALDFWSGQFHGSGGRRS